MYVLFDIGGTKTRIAISDDLTTFRDTTKFDTPKQYEEGIDAIAAAVRRASGQTPLAAVAGGIRRLLPDHSGIDHDTALPDWNGKSFVDDLAQALGAPVYVENDAAVAGLGEAHFGAGKGYDIVAYHTVSTGVGGARIDHGVIDAESIGFEPGHQIIDIDHTLCPHCKSGKLEDMVSGTAVERRFGKKPYEIPQEDPLWDELAHWLAHGLKNTIVYWSPDAVVLGGSMIVGDPRILREDIIRHTTTLLGDLMPLPVLLDATLKDEGGLYGALMLLRQRVE